MAPADWTSHEREIIDYYYRQWKRADKPGPKRNIVNTASWRCGDWKMDYDTWLARRWPQEIGRYFANRDAAENGRPRAQRKTKEQLELLEHCFSKTQGYPYTGEVLAVSFLAGIEPKKVKAWFDYERRKRKCIRNEDSRGPQTPEGVDPEEQSLEDARTISFQYSQNPKEYARKLIFGELCVRTGCAGTKEELQYPRPSLEKWWRKMYSE